VPKPYPKELCDDVVRVAENREPGVTIERIAADFGVHPMTHTKVAYPITCREDRLEGRLAVA
jgi:hypothetical protein